MRRVKDIESVTAQEYLSIDEAAILLGLRRESIRQYLYQGKLTTYKFKGNTYLKKDEVEANRS